MNTTIEKIQVLPDFKKVQILELITHPDLLVLSTGEEFPTFYFSGVFLTEGYGRKIGEFSDSLDKDKFRPFNGRIILSNDEN